MGRWLGPRSGGVMLCLCELWVWIICVGICVLCLANTWASEVPRYLFIAVITNPDPFV